jgi:hypothetical protein
MTFFLNINDNHIFNRLELITFLARNQDQHVIINTNYEGGCLESVGIYELVDCFRFKSVTFVTCNIVEHHPRYQIRIHESAFRFFYTIGTLDYEQYHTWNQKKIFGALYNRATWSRMGLAGHLQINHKDQSVINFRSDPHDDNDRRLFEMQKLFEIDISSARNFLLAADQFPVQVEDEDTYASGVSTEKHTEPLAGFYQDFLIDIVAETFVNGRNFFPTEKTTRPMLLKKPFITMGPKCHLIHLHQMGFKTFGNFWNEDYDGYGIKHKYTKIINLIDYLSNKPVDQLAQMYADMQPILDHNYNLLIEKKFSRTVNYVE